MAGPVVTYVSRSPNTRDEYQWPRPQRKSHSSTAKHVERRLIRAWKNLTGSVRRKERASILPDGFVLLNAARRRSLYIPSPA
ncbi:hypothetical protein BGW80DRAFT_1460336 [Lactifluus volemus]|nr:hypothetical protein BGW80DRAFT_1462541 [Lactifluus volemus]KAH9971653.1 hypothetical protein BGW80DRAFT_1460336 [Lactifluus volemus]